MTDKKISHGELIGLVRKAVAVLRVLEKAIDYNPYGGEKDYCPWCGQYVDPDGTIPHDTDCDLNNILIRARELGLLKDSEGIA